MKAYERLSNAKLKVVYNQRQQNLKIHVACQNKTLIIQRIVEDPIENLGIMRYSLKQTPANHLLFLKEGITPPVLKVPSLFEKFLIPEERKR